MKIILHQSDEHKVTGEIRYAYQVACVYILHINDTHGHTLLAYYVNHLI